MKYAIATIIALLTILLSISFILPDATYPTYNHIVLIEEGTATWCGPCVKAGDTLYSLFTSNDYPFFFIAFVTDKNTESSERMNNDYNILGYPTLFFDGGYKVKFGSPSSDQPYRELIEQCLARESIHDVEIDLTVVWGSNAIVNMTVDIKNNENEEYQGNLRVYVTEINSRWKMNNGKPYHYAFLDYALNSKVSIDAKEDYNTFISWDGKQHGYGDITGDNIMIVAALFNSEKHQGFSSPPANNPFDAYFVDQTVAAIPELDSPPSVDITYGPNGTIGFTNVTFQWKGNDDSTPPEDILYSYMLHSSSSPEQGEWSDWSSKKNATFLELQNGNYIFRVKALDEKNQESFSPTEREFRVDTSNPKAFLKTPFEGQENVPVYTDIIIEFTHEMDKESVENAIIIQPSIQYELHWTENRMTINPIENLGYLSTYAITIQEGAKRTSGQLLSTPYIFSFMTASRDVSPPSVTSTNPSNGSQNVSTNTNITFVFSEPMDRVFMKKSLHIDPWFSHRLHWMENDSILILEPLWLSVGVYSIVILETARDKAGNFITNPYTLQFWTRHPHILYTIPENGRQNVSVSTEICIYFSEKMDVVSLGPSIDIDPPISFSVHQNGTMIILDIPELSYETEYMITIHENATNPRGTTLDGEYVVKFVTENRNDEENIMSSFLGITTIFGILMSLFFIIKKNNKKKY